MRRDVVGLLDADPCHARRDVVDLVTRLTFHVSAPFYSYVSSD
jgi:hypothetical protein